MTAGRPGGIGTQGLGNTFATRTAGAGRLAPRPGAQRHETVTDVREGPATPARKAKGRPAAPGPETGVETPPKMPASKPTKTEKPTADKRPQIIAYLPTALADRLRAAAGESGRTHMQLVTEALDATHGRLDKLLADAGYVRLKSSGLFGNTPRPVQRRPARRGTDQVSLRPSPQVREVIDSLVEQHSAPSRSALIEIALDAHLPGS